MTITKEGNNDIEDSKQDAYFRYLKSNCFNSLYIHIIANDTYQHSLVFDKVLTNHNSSFRVWTVMIWENILNRDTFHERTRKNKIEPANNRIETLALEEIL